MQYSVYNPQIVHRRPWAGRYPYNHDAAVAWFNGKCYVAWNAHRDTHIEGRPGQVNLISESADLCNWSEPDSFLEKAEQGAVRSTDGVMWQPNLLNYKDEELWCCWCLTHPEGKSWPLEHSGTYLSRLRKGADKWVTTRIFDRIEVSGLECLAFPSQNMWLCSNGRVLAPVTLIHASGGQDGQSRHWNAAAFSDDGGETWQLSSLISQIDDTWANWEPHFHEQDDGRIRCFFRNMSRRNIGDSLHWQLTCVSDRNRAGEPLIFPHEPVFSHIETANSRVHVFKAGTRFCMLHHDAVVNHRTYDTRYNLALFCSGSGRDDFVPVQTISRVGVISAYPQGVCHDGKIIAVYTVGGSGEAREIEVAVIDADMPEDRLLIGLRSKDRVNVRTEVNADGITVACRTDLGIAPRRAQIADGGLELSSETSVSLELPYSHFYAGETLELRFECHIEQWPTDGLLVLASVGDRSAIRVALASNRPGGVFLLHNGTSQLAGHLTVGERASLCLQFNCSRLSLQVGEARACFVEGAISPKVFLGSGFDDPSQPYGKITGRFRVVLNTLECINDSKFPHASVR